MWKVVKLTDITEKIGDGLHGTPLYDDSGSYYFINGNNLNEGRIIIKADTKKVSEKEFNKYQKPLSDKTILLGINGTIGNLAFYNNEKCVLGKSACYINVNANVSKEYLYYHFKSNEFQNFLNGIATGTTIPNVPLKGLREYSFKLPSLSEQTLIAEILSSLDDKIDLLHCQNKTLEQLAETLFRQWFVEEAEEFWEEKYLAEFGKIICGKTPSKKVHSYFGGNIPFIKIPDMHGETFLFKTEDSLTEEGANSQANKLLPPKSICVSCIATVGLVSMNVLPSQTNQQINSIIPSKEIYRYFLYLKMKSLKYELLAMASGGTATDNLNTGNFSKINISFPKESVLETFHNEVNPLFEKIFANSQQIRTLTHLRDAMLPKLMNGEVKIKCD